MRFTVASYLDDSVGRWTHAVHDSRTNYYVQRCDSSVWTTGNESAASSLADRLNRGVYHRGLVIVS